MNRLRRIPGLKTGPGLSLLKPSGIGAVHQVLDMWEGVIRSSFVVDTCSISVETCVHPELDQIAARIRSPDLHHSGLGIAFDFPYGCAEWGKTACDWNSPDRHRSLILSRKANDVIIERQLDTTIYRVRIRWKGDGAFRKTGKHSFLLEIRGGSVFEFSCCFSPDTDPGGEPVSRTFRKSRRHWRRFWLSGGAVDLSGSSHGDAAELERRIVLSQYLTAVQCSGALPPQKTGLTCNSWFGKFHLEMHCWHAVHFALWGRPEMLERSLPWYHSILPVAGKQADLQGYEGVRWPKMASPDGRDSPSGIGVFLIWQQPHPIDYAELLYRIHKDAHVLERYRERVFRTAHFMSSYACRDRDTGQYNPGPPLITAQEIYPPARTRNPAFELVYWKFGLETAQRWRERLGLDRNPEWDRIIRHLAPLPVNNGLYQNAETAMNTFLDATHRNDHPALLGAFGMLPNDDVDREMMGRTLEQVLVSWNWQSTWGWDYPLMAMTAARTGRPELAVKALLMKTEKNIWLNNGHNYQTDALPVYLPGNGGLLAAVAMMAAGWDAAPERNAPGFPDDGRWVVVHE